MLGFLDFLALSHVYRIPTDGFSLQGCRVRCFLCLNFGASSNVSGTRPIDIYRFHRFPDLYPDRSELPANLDTLRSPLSMECLPRPPQRALDSRSGSEHLR